MKTIELATKQDFAIHGNLNRTPFRQLLRKVGVFKHVAFVSTSDGPMGTVSDKAGKCWDWWMNGGDVVVIPAK